MELLTYAYKQKNGWTCGPAVARAVLHYYGIKKTVPELVKSLGTTRAGTSNSKFVNYLRRHRLKFFIKEKSSIKDVRKYIKNYWLVVGYWIPNHKEGHYSIVKKIDSKRIYFHDTWFGATHSYSIPYFVKNWWDGEAIRWLLAIKK